MSITDGGPAFPIGDQSMHPLCIGMSLRDYFAAKVTIASDDLPSTLKIAEFVLGRKCPDWNTDWRGAIQFHAELEALIRGIKADAMIAERQKGREG